MMCPPVDPERQGMSSAVSRKDYIMTWSNTVTCCNGWLNFWLFCSANKKAPAVGAAGADVLERNQWLRLHWPVASLLCPFLRICQAGVCHAFSQLSRFFRFFDATSWRHSSSALVKNIIPKKRKQERGLLEMDQKSPADAGLGFTFLIGGF